MSSVIVIACLSRLLELLDVVVQSLEAGFPDRPVLLGPRRDRFEWTRAQFREWAQRIGESYGYAVRFLPVGPEDDAVGAPTQMAVFERN